MIFLVKGNGVISPVIWLLTGTRSQPNAFSIEFYNEQIIIIIIIIIIRQFIRCRIMSLKSLQGRRTPSSRDECRTTQDGRRPLDQAHGLEPCTPPLPFFFLLFSLVLFLFSRIVEWPLAPWADYTIAVALHCCSVDVSLSAHLYDSWFSAA